MEKCSLFNFDVVMAYRRPTGIRAQKNSDMLCGVFNTDRSQFKSMSLHKREPSPLKHSFIEIVNTTNLHKRT